LQWLVDGSSIDGSSRYLGNDGGVRGVSRIGEADAPKKSAVQTYTSKQVQTLVNKSLDKVGIKGSAQKLVLSDLEKRLK
jgi:hypothetical protein